MENRISSMQIAPFRFSRRGVFIFPYFCVILIPFGIRRSLFAFPSLSCIFHQPVTFHSMKKPLYFMRQFFCSMVY